MSDGIQTAAQLQARIKSVVSDAKWGGIKPEVIAAILAAEAETAKSK